MQNRKQVAWLCIIGAWFAHISYGAPAQQKYPSKPIRIVVATTPGGSTDILGRLIATKMSEHWGHPVVIENRPGGSGIISTQLVAKATPDGYTLLITGPGVAIAAALFDNRAIDPRKDLAGVTTIGNSNTVVVASPALNVRSVKELVAYAQARPGKIFFATPPAGSTDHLNTERFRLAAGIRAQHVSFKGGPECLIEVAAGRAHFTTAGLTAAMPFIKDGKVVALLQRIALLPGVPVAADVLPEWKQIGGMGIYAPAGTPVEIRRQLARETARILDLPDIREKLASVSLYVSTSTPEEHERKLREDIEAFTMLVKQIGLRPG